MSTVQDRGIQVQDADFPPARLPRRQSRVLGPIIFLVCLLTALASIIFYRPTERQPPVHDVITLSPEPAESIPEYHPECSDLIESLYQLGSIPLPHLPASDVHWTALKEAGDTNPLNRILNGHLRVDSAIKDIGELFTEVVASVATIFISLAPATEDALRQSSLAFYVQVQKTKLHVGNLIEAYNSARSTYHDLNTTTYQMSQPSDPQYFFLLMGEKWWSYFPWANATRKYLVPMEENLKKRRNTQMAIVALDREDSRILRISKVIEELIKSLESAQQDMFIRCPAIQHPTSSSQARQPSVTDRQEEDRRDQGEEHTSRQCLIEVAKQHMTASIEMKASWKRLVEPGEDSRGTFDLTFDLKWCKNLKTGG
ncbi:MAG: hypothetical protein Q9220_007612 [cf. Caloplaca sp. 1 TL-2023]